MNPFRMIYLKAGRVLGFTFRAQDAEQATVKASRWADLLGVILLTVK